MTGVGGPWGRGGGEGETRGEGFDAEDEAEEGEEEAEEAKSIYSTVHTYIHTYSPGCGRLRRRLMQPNQRTAMSLSFPALWMSQYSSQEAHCEVNAACHRPVNLRRSSRAFCVLPLPDPP